MVKYLKKDCWIDGGGDDFYLAIPAEDSVDIENAEPTMLSESAYAILQCCEQEVNFEDIIKKLKMDYDIEEEQYDSIHRCIELLLNSKLICEINY